MPARRTGFAAHPSMALVCAAIALLPSSPATGTPEGAADAVPSHWLRLGGFRGSASSEFGQEVRDALFGIEQDGDLYEDLGNLALEVEVDEKDFEAEWKNSFHRKIDAKHDHLPLGSTITGDDLSAYVDSQGMISRLRLKYEWPEKLTGDLVLGAQAERGYALTLARRRQPLVFGDRPLDEVLTERGADNFQQIAKRAKGEQTDLLELTGKALSEVTRWIAQGVSSSVDSERGEIFFEDAADPLTLYWDVGIPVPMEMFQADDSRLSVGDRIRQVTFASVSPLTAGIEETGVEISYETFFRFLRETTLIKEPDNQVLVSVQHNFLDGLEFRPLKVRPELRFLKIVKLGYTFFEHRYNRGRTASNAMVYRVDLDDPAGVEALSALLGEGTDVRFRPMTAAADRGEGAELLFEEARRGKRRIRSTRFRLIGPFRFDDRRTLFLDDVHTGDLTFRELGLARTRRFRKRIGRDRDWSKQFLIRSLGERPPEASTADPAANPGPTAVNLLSGLHSRQTSATEVAQEANRIADALGEHPVLDLLCSVSEDGESDFFVSLRVSFGREHLDYFRTVPERRVWTEIAEILLGAEHGREWETPASRRRWIDRTHRGAFLKGLGGDVASLPQPTRVPLNLRRRFKLAQRTAKKYQRIREMLSKSECIGCLGDALGREKDVLMQQVLLFRLAAESGVGEPGYGYEIFGEPLLSPVTVTNDVRYDYNITAPTLDEVLGDEPSHRSSEAEEAIRRAGASRSILGGAYTLVRASDPRLRAADLYLELGPPAGEEPQLRLRLFSDYRFDPELALRIDTRRSRVLAGDQAEGLTVQPLGEALEIVETPFSSGRFSYDIVIPPVPFEKGVAYTLLLRVLNPEGRPVSEEQQVRFTWPTDEQITTQRSR